MPLGTHTGWNLRLPETGFGDHQTPFDGSFVPFARTEAERGSDPRPSIASRYPTKADFVAKTRSAAARLAKEGFILGDEVEEIVAARAAFYDRVMAREPGDQRCQYLFAD